MGHRNGDAGRDSEDESIVPVRPLICSMDRCWCCGATQNLERHHVFGGPNRARSEEDGMVVMLCAECHRGTHGVHRNAALSLQLKKEAEKVWLAYKGLGVESFRRKYGKNYLDNEDLYTMKEKIWSGRMWKE